MSTEENKAIVRRYLQEGPRNPDIAAESLASDAVYYDSGAPPSVGLEGQKQRTNALLGAFPNVSFTIEDMVAEADKVAVRWNFQGTHRGPFANISATGEEVVMTGMTIYRLEGGKIKEARSNFDMLGLLQQLGAVPAPER